MGDILYTLLIKPLELIFELIFAASYDMLPNPAVNLVIMSLAINLLVLPLYRRADIIQAEAKAKENAIRPMVEHIKKSFKGDEKVMMLQTYYDQKNYHPLSSMKSIISLLLQIPFFIAAYQFLSHLTLLSGQSMGPIKDLSQPDGLIVIGSLTINLLPILMTVINIVSSEIYTKGQPFKDKIVLYLSAAIFLVLLYDSPSGLVFYWTFNNVFSLVKNVVYKFIEPKENKSKKTVPVTKAEQLVYLFGSIYLALFTGGFIPSSVVSSATADFIAYRSVYNPANYIWFSLGISIGIFVIWLGVYYLLSSDTIKRVFGFAVFSLSLSATLHYFLFGNDLGVMSADLLFDHGVQFDTMMIVISAVTFVAVFALGFFLFRKFSKFVYPLLLTGAVVMLMMSAMNIALTNSAFDAADEMINGRSAETPRIELSKTGKNVVVIMMDRAIGGLVPYLFEEKKELYNDYDGFTFYPNTISFGPRTNFGAPALYGGYDYTTENMNARDDLSLKDKHNEALLVLPVLFTQNNYISTVVSPPFANYNRFVDLSIYDQYEGINAFSLDGIANEAGIISNMSDVVRCRNFFFYSIMRTSPLCVRRLIYDEGNYNALPRDYYDVDDSVLVSPETHEGTSKSQGVTAAFVNEYYALSILTDLTVLSDSQENCFAFIQNGVPHEFALLKEPGYTLSNNVDNTEYDREMSGRTFLNGTVMHLDTYEQMAAYHANMLGYTTLAQWFTYLKDNGLWDNTRIIIAADHGYNLGHFDSFVMDDIGLDIEYVNPVLMVKDFDSHGFTTSDEFMTNADVASIAAAGVISDPKNPFTGNPINSDPKTSQEQKILISEEWDINVNNGNRFLPGSWYSVHDNIFDRNNWKYLGDY